MIMYPLTKIEDRIVRWMPRLVCIGAVASCVALNIIWDILDWFENLIPLMEIGIEA